MTDEQGRTVVVTGGTRGIGRAIVETFAQTGHRILLTGTDGDRAREVAAAVAAKTGAEVFGIASQSGDDTSGEVLAAEVRARWPRLDVLVNNAAIAKRGAVTDVPLDEWNEVFRVNLTGPFLLIKALVPLMTGATPTIVNVASQAGKRGQALLGPYSASKAGMINLTKTLALELAPAIRINSVCPGYVETEMMLEHFEVEGTLRGTTGAAVRAEMLANVPLGRMQQPSSVAGLVAFLAGSESQDMTGQSINITGGMVTE